MSPPFAVLADFDALGERAEVVAPVATAVGAHSLAGVPGECFEGLGSFGTWSPSISNAN